MNPTEKVLYATIAARPPSTIPPTPTPLVAIPIALEGPVSVVANSYSIGKTAYSTTVAFKVKNPNADITATGIPYRVTIKGGGKVLFTSDGKDTVGIPAGTTRLVLFDTSDIVDVRPETDEVQLYPAPSMYSKPQGEASQADWAITNPGAQCGNSTVQCNFNADLQWNGQGTRGRVRVMVVAHQGTDTTGPIIAAGFGEITPDTMSPGQIAPMTATLDGFDQPRESGSAVLPTRQITYEYYVESAPQR